MDNNIFPSIARYGLLGAAELYAMFLAGQGIHILRRASAAIQSKVNPIATRKEFVVRYWPEFLARGAVALVAFWSWINYPDLVSKYTGFNIAIPVGGGTALMFGMASDMILDWALQKWPKLRQIIPFIGEQETVVEVATHEKEKP